VLYGQIAPNPPNVENLKSQLAALSNQYRLTYDSYTQLAAAGPPTSRFSTLQKAASVPIDEDEYDARLDLGASSRNNLTASSGSDSLDQAVTVSTASTSVDGPAARGLLGAVLGFLLGVGIALLLVRLNRRILGRADAEAAFHLPVLAEVPKIKQSQQRENVLVAHSAPLSRFTEAHRAIRSSILFTRASMDAEGATASGLGARRGQNGDLGGSTLFAPGTDDPLVVMITSASPGEGKTTTTANLAAVFAEGGASVLVMNCDFRRPTIHRYFGLEDEPRRVHETNVPGVKLVTNVFEDPASNPSQVVAAQRQVVAVARDRFDVILLDTAPLLTANDAVDLVSSADMLLLVARVGATRTDTAERSVELLNRLDVAVAGVVLVGVASASNDYYYYYQPGRVAAPAARKRGSAVNGKARSTDAELFVADADPAESRPNQR